MKDPIPTISLMRLALAFVPVLIVVVVLFRWSINTKTAVYAVGRMLAQLMLIGYVLAYIFESDSVAIVASVLAVMLFAASWISLHPLKQKSRSVYVKALASIAVGGGVSLVIVTQGVLDLEVWYQPRYVIPLAGMIFSSSMNSVSLAGERFESEAGRGSSFIQCRLAAMNASLIPLINSLFAVGLVSLPGMMTGQILAGAEPLIAARYQVMVMCMVFGAAGISAACFLTMFRSMTQDAPDSGE
jgi:putative ABC transport system permease protein